MKGARQLILVGDHRQLPPTVTSRSAEDGGLNIPLFERLLSNGIPAHMLTTQYRMHPTIREFPSARFYDNRLEDGCSSSERPPVAGFLWPIGTSRFLSYQCTGRKLKRRLDLRVHMDEAAIVIKVVNDLLIPGDLSPEDIGVISPMLDRLDLFVAC